MVRKRINLAIVVIVVMIIIGLTYVEGRGGRGGGGRGGGGRGGRVRGGRGRGGGSGSTTRRTGSTRSSSIRSYSGPVYKSSMWKTGAAIGFVAGLSSFQRRRMYLKSPGKEPKVCFNSNNLRNGTYGYFICPEPTLPDMYGYCCGDKGDQECCTYSKYKEYQKEKTVNGVIGAIVGVIIFAIIVGVLVYCCIIKKRRQRVKKSKTKGIKEQQPLKHATGPATPMQPYQDPAAPPQGTFGDPTGYDGGPGGLPYNPSPMGPPGQGLPPDQYPPPGVYPPPEQYPPPGMYPPPGQYPSEVPPQGEPAPVGFKDGADGLPYSLNPEAPPPPAPAPSAPALGPGGFVQPGQDYPPPPGVPLVQPPPYPGN